jgi:hypothetical protein
VARRILDHLGMDSQGPPLTRAKAPDEAGADAGPEYDLTDPVYPD